MRQALRLRSSRITLLVGLLGGLGLAMSRLLGIHGAESALALGLLLPPFVAVAACRSTDSLRAQGLKGAAGHALVGALSLAATAWALPVGILALNALRIRNCSPGVGFAFMVLGPGFGVLLAAVVGVAFGAFLRMPRLAATLAGLTPLLFVGLGVHEFWSSPGIAIFGHFGGWFPGTIYDEGVEVPMTFVTFRLTTLLLALGLSLAVRAGWRSGDGSRVGRASTRPASLALAAMLLGLVGAAHAKGAELGHRSSEAFIVETLGATLEGERCIVHLPRETPRESAARLLADCDFRVTQAATRLGVDFEGPMVAYFYRSASEKRRLMGAGRTFIAKPWRGELHLQLRGWPHPVLAHEVVHSVAAAAASGPFRIAGSWGGWLPDPALIEGVAVATAWDIRDGLTPHQGARALSELGRLPAVRDVMGLSFLRHPASIAYTTCGSLLRWVGDTHGAASVREAYRTGDLEAATGASLEQLESEWHVFLATVDVPEASIALARVRFERPSIFSAICPHTVALLRAELAGDVAATDLPRIVATCDELLAIDASDLSARATLVGARARLGDYEQAARELALLEGRLSAPEPYRVAARQRLADARWAHGDEDIALSLYRDLLSRPQVDDNARGTEVKLTALEGGGEQARLVFELLVGDGRPAASPVVVHLAQKLAVLRPDGLGPYLEARQLAANGSHERAVPVMQAALDRGLPTTRLRHEAERMLVSSLYAAAQMGMAERLLFGMSVDPSRSEAQKLDALDWIARVEWAAERPLTN